MGKITIDSVIADLYRVASTGVVESPMWWLNQSVILKVLEGNENDKLAILGQQVADAKKVLLENEDNLKISEVKIYIEASDLYRDYRKQEARVEQIQELVLLGKKQATIRAEEMKPVNQI